MEMRQALKSAESSPVEELTSLEPFRRTLAKHGLKFERADTTTLQINVGLLCNQACKHCHLDASPRRTELMDEDTLNEIVALAEKTRFEIIDITGGAPELHPNLIAIIERLSPLGDKLIVRSNLSALEEKNPDQLIRVFGDKRAVVVASLPAVNQAQTESQRGKGVFDKSITALKRLNEAGYGRDETGLELNLVSNPTGAFLPPSQAQAEKRFRVLLRKNWGIVFNHLFTFANVPLGRFRDWLLASGNLENYLERLASSFNLCAVEKVMCRSLMSVAWDGYVYDCDFNLAKGLPMAGRKTHISEMERPPSAGTPIAVADHCYACTAGAGFT